MSFLENYIDFNFDKVTFEPKTTLASSDKINITGTITNTSATISNGSIILGNNSIWKLEAMPMFNFDFTSDGSSAHIGFSFNDGSQYIGTRSFSSAKYRNIHQHSYASLFLIPSDFAGSTMTINMLCSSGGSFSIHTTGIGDGTPFLNIMEIPAS